MNTVGVLILIIILLAVATFFGWCAYEFIRAPFYNLESTRGKRWDTDWAKASGVLIGISFILSALGMVISAGNVGYTAYNYDE